MSKSLSEEHLQAKMEEMTERLELLERTNRDLAQKNRLLTHHIAEMSRPGTMFDLHGALDRMPKVLDGSHVIGEGISSGEREVGVGLFRQKVRMQGHNGAVYDGKFSASGRLLATGSFDRALRIWNIEESTDRPMISIPDAHASSITTLAWSRDGDCLVTGGFDHRVRLWDVSSLSDIPLVTLHANGLVLAVTMSPTEQHLAFISSSRKMISVLDSRAGRPQSSPSMSTAAPNVVNALFADPCSPRLLGGDRCGAIIMWDLRVLETPLAQIVLHHNDRERRPITDIHVSEARYGEEEGRFVAVNSYDDCLRVYDRGTQILNAESETFSLHQCLRGHQNQNWPIKSSFYRGADYKCPQFLDESQQSLHEEEDLVHQPFITTESGSLRNALLLATGSADGSCYVYDVGGPRGTGKLLQVLHGHGARVYSVAFHPAEPILASCGCDGTVAIWSPSKTRSRT